MMPPHMAMDRDTSADAMRDLSYAAPKKVTASYDLNRRGDQELGFRLENGVKVFELTPAPVRWAILPGVTVEPTPTTVRSPGLASTSNRAITFGSSSPTSCLLRQLFTGTASSCRTTWTALWKSRSRPSCRGRITPMSSPRHSTAPISITARQAGSQAGARPLWRADH